MKTASLLLALTLAAVSPLAAQTLAYTDGATARTGAFTAERPAPRLGGWVHLNGYSHHFSAPDANSALLGLGYTWYTRQKGSIVHGWEADVFRDSGSKFSAYVAHSWTIPTRFLAFGVSGGLMYHESFRTENPYKIFPMAVPYVEAPLGAIKARFSYVPPIRRASDHQVTLQLLVPLSANR